MYLCNIVQHPDYQFALFKVWSYGKKQTAFSIWSTSTNEQSRPDNLSQINCLTTTPSNVSG